MSLVHCASPQLNSSSDWPRRCPCLKKDKFNSLCERLSQINFACHFQDLRNTSPPENTKGGDFCICYDLHWRVFGFAALGNENSFMWKIPKHHKVGTMLKMSVKRQRVKEIFLCISHHAGRKIFAVFFLIFAPKPHNNFRAVTSQIPHPLAQDFWRIYLQGRWLFNS